MKKLLIIIGSLIFCTAAYSQQIRSSETAILDNIAQVATYQGGGKVILLRDSINGGFFYWYGGPLAVDGLNIVTGANGSKWRRSHFKEVQIANLAIGTRTATTVPITNTLGTGFTLSSATATLAGLIGALEWAYLDSLRRGLIRDTLYAGAGLHIKGDTLLAATVFDSVSIKDRFLSNADTTTVDSIPIPSGTALNIEVNVIGIDENSGNFGIGSIAYNVQLHIHKNLSGTMTLANLRAPVSSSISVSQAPYVDVKIAGNNIIIRIKGLNYRYRTKAVRLKSFISA